MTDTDNTAPVYIKTMLTLPQEVGDAFVGLEPDARDAYIVALRENKWTLASIAAVAGVTRERVRQIAGDSENSNPELVASLPLPEPPRREVKAKREFVEPSEETLTRLLELQPIAERYRANAAPQVRAAAQEYTKLIDYANRVEGVPLYRLAKRLGKTHGALRFRLARYGLREPINANSKAYRLLSKFVLALMPQWV